MEESFETSQSSRQVETTSTRPEVIDVTRQRQHRQDHEDGHRYCGGSRRQSIDKLGPVERVQDDTLYWSRTDGRQPSCNHPLRTPNQIVSDWKTTTVIHGSASVKMERRPRVSENREKRRTIDSLSDIEKVSQKPLFIMNRYTPGMHFEFHIFPAPCGVQTRGSSDFPLSFTFFYSVRKRRSQWLLISCAGR